MDKERFTMLLLEPGEIYFEDFSSDLLDSNDSASETRLPGRLKLCSKSLVFEPKIWSKPLLKIQFKDCVNISQWNGHRLELQNLNAICINCKQYTEMMEENTVAPYIFKYNETEFIFVLNYASINTCVEQMRQLQRASTLHAPDQNSMIATISYSRHSRIPFDRVLLEDLYETILLEISADRITPLVQNPGKLVLTEKMLYFQPYNNIELFPVLKIPVKEMKQVFRRRFLLRQVGLELYNEDGCKVPHLYLAMRNEDDRDLLYEKLIKLPGINLHKFEMDEMTMQWQNGVISNYDYLTYINCLADRSKNDLTQYPVFPWVISNYTSSKLDLLDTENYRDLSKPMGKLDKERWLKLKERYDDMAEPKFMYGSHYSAPGLVLFYLVRKFPRYMLCLQNGRFDHPDRMFNNIADVYNNCLQNLSDFKELIPEFYDEQSNGDFLTNIHKIDFGYRHDEKKIGDVLLPPWAESANHFVKTLRNALESDYVSRNLNDWIDLIFGYKQKGKEAVKANNLFFHLCYEGAVDLDIITDMNERHALEVQIMEFGQVPKQIFLQPHVKKLTPVIERPLNQPAMTCSTSEQYTTRVDLESSLLIHKEAVTYVIMMLGGNKVVSVGKDGLLKVYNLMERKQSLSVNIGSPSLSCCVALDDNRLIIGCSDNNIVIYDLEYNRVIDSFRAHEDSVSCLVWCTTVSLLISGGWDCAVRIWRNLEGVQRGCFRPFQSLLAELDHDAGITCLTVDQDERRILSGTIDGEVSVWDLQSHGLIQRIQLYHSSLTGVCCISGGKRMVTCSNDGELRVTDLTMLVQVFSKKVSESITCLHWNDTDIIWLGSADGKVLIWNLKTVMQVCEFETHSHSVTGIHKSELHNVLITGGADGHVKIWKESSN